MDSQSLDMLVEEINERAEWYGQSPANYTAETFALGWVAGNHGLQRDETEELLIHYNRHLKQQEQLTLAHNLIQSAIRNVN